MRKENWREADLRLRRKRCRRPELLDHSQNWASAQPVGRPPIEASTLEALAGHFERNHDISTAKGRFVYIVPRGEALHISRFRWFGSISIAIIALYLIGVFVRGRYGIEVSVHNVSGEPARDLHLKLEPDGRDFPLGVLPNEERARAFVQPRRESHIVLQYADVSGTHTDTIVGYIESGYCGKTEVSISSQHKVTSRESIDPVFCNKSWLDFM